MPTVALTLIPFGRETIILSLGRKTFGSPHSFACAVTANSDQDATLLWETRYYSVVMVFRKSMEIFIPAGAIAQLSLEKIG